MRNPGIPYRRSLYLVFWHVREKLRQLRCKKSGFNKRFKKKIQISNLIINQFNHKAKFITKFIVILSNVMKTLQFG